MSDTYCDKHNQAKTVMGGCSAHASNWYCEECDIEKNHIDICESAVPAHLSWCCECGVPVFEATPNSNDYVYCANCF